MQDLTALASKLVNVREAELDFDLSSFYVRPEEDDLCYTSNECLYEWAIRNYPKLFVGLEYLQVVGIPVPPHPLVAEDDEKQRPSFSLVRTMMM